MFLVETSRAMQRRGPGLFQTVQDLLGSGMNGQVHAGDSLGVWTFNDKLHAGQFPLQEWATRGQGAVTVRVLNFLKEQPYERKAN
ncbi:MAG TPA: hypothetical protein VNZ22_19295, partial [Bacillota bacterium]|nr:hypothetical protein [Bacillota bacterium]